MNDAIKRVHFNQGFTLIEIMVALTIFSIVAAGIFISYSGQQKSELSQTQVVEMQQSIRSAMYLMSREVRMAGYDPHRAFSSGIVSAGDGSAGSPLTFTYVEGDTDTDNGSLATVSYELYDARSDGDQDIGRQKNGDKWPVAENIQSLGFSYLDTNGVVLPPPVTIADIRAVKIHITAGLDAGSTDHTIPGTVRSVSTVVYCRNLGL